METLSSFWSGAVRLGAQRSVGAEGEGLTLEGLAVRAGGWGPLVHATDEELAGWGARWDVIHQLRATPPLPTAGRAVTRACPDYPTKVASVPGAPPVLFVEGDVSALERRAVAVVGTRHHTPYGASVAHRIAWSCARAGLVVVSGLAMGIDSHAHGGALAARGATVAVLGHGLAHTSPPSNTRLRERIAAEGGALVTAHPDAVPPSKHTFPERNRWIAALAARVVVVEAPERSGALHTAQALAAQRRSPDLVVVPGPLGAPTWKGSADLLQSGARPLVDLDAFVAELVGVPGGERHPDWLAALFAGATVADAAAVRGVEPLQLLRELSHLELQGRVVRLPGGRFAPAGA